MNELTMQFNLLSIHRILQSMSTSRAIKTEYDLVFREASRIAVLGHKAAKKVYTKINPA